MSRMNDLQIQITEAIEKATAGNPAELNELRAQHPDLITNDVITMLTAQLEESNQPREEQQ